MILVVRRDGKTLNLSAAKLLGPHKSHDYPEGLCVEFADSSKYIIDNLSLQDFIDQTAGRIGPVIFRRYFRTEK